MWNPSPPLAQGKVSEASFTDGYTRKFLGILDPTHYGICDVSVGSSLLIVASTHLFVTLTFVSLVVLTIVLLPSPLLIVFGCMVVVAWIVCTVYSYLSYRDSGSSSGRLVIHVLYPTSAGLTITSFLAVGIVFAASTQVFLLGLSPENLLRMGYLNANDIAALLYYRAAAASQGHVRSVWDVFWFLEAHIPIHKNWSARLSFLEDMRLLSDTMETLGLLDLTSFKAPHEQPLASAKDSFASTSTASASHISSGALDANGLTKHNAQYGATRSSSTISSEALPSVSFTQRETNTGKDVHPAASEGPGNTPPPSSSSEIPTDPTTEAVPNEYGGIPQLELKVTVPVDINKSQKTSTTTSAVLFSNRRGLSTVMLTSKTTRPYPIQPHAQPPLSNVARRPFNDEGEGFPARQLIENGSASGTTDLLVRPQATTSLPTFLSSDNTQAALEDTTTLKAVSLSIPRMLAELQQHEDSLTGSVTADDKKKHLDYKDLFRLISIRNTLLTLQFRLGTGLLITGVLLIPTALIWGWFIWSATYRAIVVARAKQMSLPSVDGV